MPMEPPSHEPLEDGKERSVGGGKLVSARRRQHSKPEGEARWEGSERGEEGVEDGKEETMRGIEG
ncbi:hypothetical protein GJ744_008593 [Endocarpon pusillum]|uniref:Uncharacterized protein n=1 Tax=Endocarpon pusillum TaxID=364733 RepID=A0A8H7E379_9EURO|nr:hypothetical protein GJ744_008593 [Endocarpon pusillum]